MSDTYSDDYSSDESDSNHNHQQSSAQIEQDGANTAVPPEKPPSAYDTNSTSPIHSARQPPQESSPAQPDKKDQQGKDEIKQVKVSVSPPRRSTRKEAKTHNEVKRKTSPRPGEEASTSHERHRHQQHLTALPSMMPSTRNASQLMQQYVEQPLLDTIQWTPTPILSEPKSVDFPYVAEADPALRHYWLRKHEIKDHWRKERQRRRENQVHQKEQHRLNNLKVQSLYGATNFPARISTAPESSLPRLEAEQLTPTSSHHDINSIQRASTVGSQVRPQKRVKPIEVGKIAKHSMNQKPFSKKEFLALRTIFGGATAGTLNVMNIDLQWLSPLIDGTTPASKAHKIADKSATLNLLNFNANVLADDPTKYSTTDPFTKHLLNSPRSTVVLLRNGLDVYSLLQRPVKFYTQIGEAKDVSFELLQERQRRENADRAAVLEAAQLQYRAMCEAYSLNDVVSFALPPPLGETAQQLVQQRVAKEQKQAEMLEIRTMNMLENMRAQREANANRALQIEILLAERAEEKKEMVEKRAAATRAKIEEKRKILERIDEQMMKMKLEVAEKSQEKMKANTERVLHLQMRRQQEQIEKSLQNEQKMAHSKKLVEEDKESRIEHLTHLQTIKQKKAEEFQERVMAEQEALKHRQEDNHEKQQLCKQRADELLMLKRQAVDAKIEAAELRLKDFHQKQFEERRVQAILHERRTQQLHRALDAAKKLEEERAQLILDREEEAMERQRQREAQARQETLLVAEASSFARAQKGRVVTVGVRQNNWEKMLVLAEMAEKEAAIDAYYKHKQEDAKHMADARRILSMEQAERKDRMAETTLAAERFVADKIYRVTNAPEEFPQQYENVKPKIDVGPELRTSPKKKRRPSSSEALKRKPEEKSTEEPENTRSHTSMN